jgi:hypothetical protein
MGLRFTSASSQYMVNSAPPITTLPVRFWGWAYTTTVGAGNASIFTFNSATANFSLYRKVTQYGTFGGAEAVGGTVVVGQWFFWVFRLISATSRRVTILSTAGDITEITTTTNTSITAANWTLGVTNIGSVGTDFWDGGMAEFGAANIDIVPGGGVMDNTLLTQLAFQGPLTIPHIAAALDLYVPFISQTRIGIETPSEGYWGDRGRSTWTAPNGLQLGPHPPIYGNFPRRQYGRQIVPF